MTINKEHSKIIDASSEPVILKSEKKVLTSSDTRTVIPTSALKNIDLNSVPAIIQEAINSAVLDIKEQTLADGVLSELREDIDTFKDGIFKKQFINNKISYLEELIGQKANEDTIASIADARLVVATKDLATTNQVNILSSRLGNSESEILRVRETINTKDSARALQIDAVEARMNDNIANYSDVLDLTVDNEGNLKAEKIESLQISYNDQAGDIQAMKNQIDGVVQTFQGDYGIVDASFKPLINVEPYKAWYDLDLINNNAIEREKHTGDTYIQYEIVDSERKYLGSWKFVKTDTSFPNADNDGFCWSAIIDSTAIDAYKQAIEAKQLIAQQQITITETTTLLNTVQGWSANASKLIKDSFGNITGWSFGDGSNQQSLFKILADKFIISSGNQSYIPFEIDTDAGEITLRGKVKFSSVKNVPDFTTKEEVATELELQSSIALDSNQTFVSIIGNRVRRVGGGTGWNAQAYSKNSFTGGCSLTFKSNKKGVPLMVGINKDPSTNSSYSSIDFCFYQQYSANNNTNIYESGSNRVALGTDYPVESVYKIIYDGKEIIYYVDNIEVRSIYTGENKTFFIDSSFYLNADFTILEWTSYTSNTWIKEELDSIDTSLSQNEIDKANLDAKIDAEEQNRINAINAEQSARASELVDRIQSETNLDGIITANEAKRISDAENLETVVNAYTDIVAESLIDKEISDAEANAIYQANLKIEEAKEDLEKSIAQSFNIVPCYNNADYNTISYDKDEQAIKLQSNTASTIGMAFPAFRVNTTEGEKFKISLSYKTNIAKSSGLYIRIYEYDSELPNGKTHVSSSSSNSAPCVQQRTRDKLGWKENQPVSTTWQTSSHDYIPTLSAKWVSIVILNWAGMGLSPLFIKGFQIQTKFGGIASMDSLDLLSSKITGVLPTEKAHTDLKNENIDIVENDDSITLTGVGNTNTINLPNGNDTENSVTTIAKPKGGNHSSSSTKTGAIVVVLPNSWTNTMMSFDIDVYNYSQNKSFLLKVGGYNYSGSRWVYTFANLIGSALADNRVRFGHDGTKCCIVIGNINSSWVYPKISVKNAVFGYTNYSKDSWKNGWEVKITSDLNGYTFTQNYEDSLIDANSIKNQGILATQDSVDLSQLPDAVKNDNINWVAEVQVAIADDTTVIDGGKIVSNQAFLNTLNALGITAKNVEADTFYGKKFIGTIFEGAVIKASYLDLDGELEVLTNYHISISSYNSNPSLYIDAVLISASNEYRIPTISTVREESKTQTIEDGTNQFNSKIFSYNASNVGTNLKAVKVRPTLTITEDIVLMEFKYNYLNGSLFYSPKYYNDKYTFNIKIAGHLFKLEYLAPGNSYSAQGGLSSNSYSTLFNAGLKINNTTVVSQVNNVNMVLTYTNTYNVAGLQLKVELITPRLLTAGDNNGEGGGDPYFTTPSLKVTLLKGNFLVNRDWDEKNSLVDIESLGFIDRKSWHPNTGTSHFSMKQFKMTTDVFINNMN
jgi:hypothetical protein